jgi:hypothetical protein
MTRQVEPFTTRSAFQAQLQLCFSRARLRLQMFDPDFAQWGLGTREVDATLRRFLMGKGKIELVAHDNAWLERQCPRFLVLLRDFGPAIECRVSGRHLRQLSDSFCIGDGRDIVRRFHSAYLRGEAVFDGPIDTEISAERFYGIWSESMPGLHASVTGL